MDKTNGLSVWREQVDDACWTDLLDVGVLGCLAGSERYHLYECQLMSAESAELNVCVCLPLQPMPEGPHDGIYSVVA